MEFKIDPRAFIDIQEQIDFYNLQQKGLGKKFHSEIKVYFKAIQKNPFYQIRYDNFRCLPLKIFPAMIHFSINEEEQLIVAHAVIGTRKNPKGNWV